LTNTETFKVCTHCVLDTTDAPHITFNEQGVCSYCQKYEELARTTILRKPAEKHAKLLSIAEEIKKEGKGKKYDCVIGVSGGLDSTFLVYKAVELGLRPLLVHYNNGWNSGTAVKNIENLTRSLKLDLYTYVNDWEEFKDLQRSFFKASVIDIELVTDQAIVAIIINIAIKKNIKYTLFGNNMTSESVLPENWYHWKLDVLNIEAIHKQFGKVPLKTYPVLGFWRRWYAIRMKSYKNINLLDYVDYDIQEAKKIAEEKLGWESYGRKHYESVFTRFYQAYILPRKFGVDKRKAHLSSLILCGQITREQALEELKKEIYPKELFAEDKAYVLKKLGFSEEEFEKIMALPVKQHTDYPSYLTRHYIYQEKFSKLFRKFFG
jgi:N-acetyl sugar amidotransferase